MSVIEVEVTYEGPFGGQYLDTVYISGDTAPEREEALHTELCELSARVQDRMGWQPAFTQAEAVGTA